MENLKPDFPVVVTARHMENTESIRNYVETKLARIHMKYPRVMDAKVIADNQRHGQKVEIILHCADHIVIEADTETPDLYEAIDITMEKIERQMRKAKTKRQKRLGHH
jgi:putative sigma-54 modulation protein